MKARNLYCMMAAVWLLGLSLPASAQVANNNIKKTTGYAPVNGLKLYYEVYGEGQPLVLLHGSYMTIDLNWSQIMPALAKNHKVIAIEMQGHGRTADIDRPVSYKALADDVAGLLKHLKIDSADILGYSLGGTVAFQFGIQYPRMVKKLIAISTVYKYTGWQPEVLDVLKIMSPEFLDNTPLKQAYTSVAPQPNNWSNFLKKYIAFDKLDFDLGANNIKAFKFPVLLIMGDNDGVDLNHKVDMYKLVGGGAFADMTGLPKSQLAIVPAATHVTLMLHTEKLASIILPFIDNVPPLSLPAQ
jgi:pimeloyl-ACP methyl ester carboxylesterase